MLLIVPKNLWLENNGLHMQAEIPFELIQNMDVDLNTIGGSF